MAGMTTDLSPMAEILLNRLRGAPDRRRYDIEVFPGLFREPDVERLDAAYRELEAAGLIERTGEMVFFFGNPKRIYRLSDRGRALVGPVS